MNKSNDIFKEAIRRSGRGTMARIAREFGVAHPAVQKWVKNGVPVERVIPLIRAFGEELGIKAHDLRPDLFGPQPKQKARKHETENPLR